MNTTEEKPQQINDLGDDASSVLDDQGVIVSGTGSKSDTPLTEAGSLTVRAKRKTGYIYFIRAGDHIKIGYSTRPLDRIKNLQISNPGRLEILGTRWASRDLEKELHAHFDRWHVRGEWFKAARPIIRYIEDGTPEGIAAAKKRRGDSLDALGPAPIKRRRDPATTAKLIAKRVQFGSKSPAGFRCSNLIEQLDHFANAAGEQRGALEVFIGQQMIDLARLSAPYAEER